MHFHINGKQSCRGNSVKVLVQKVKIIPSLIMVEDIIILSKNILLIIFMVHSTYYIVMTSANSSQHCGLN
jgi:hypothetical protein